MQKGNPDAAPFIHPQSQIGAFNNTISRLHVNQKRQSGVALTYGENRFSPARPAKPSSNTLSHADVKNLSNTTILLC